MQPKITFVYLTDLFFGLNSAPVAAMGVLFFIEFKIFDADYFDSFYQSREIPVPFALIDEIAERHPLARPKIFELIKKGLTHRYRLETTQLVCSRM